MLAVVRTTNEPPRQPKIPSTTEASARVWFWPSHACLLALLASRPPCAPQKTPRGHTLAAKHTQGVVPVSLCMAVASYSGHAACPVLPACMPQRRACVAWISGHPLRKAPTVDRTAPGILVACHAMAWRGRVPTAYYCVYSQGLGSAGVAEESESYELGPARVLCANTSSFRCSWMMMARPAVE